MQEIGYVLGVAENDMDISPIRVLSLFSGAGGLELGSKLASPRFKTVCYVEKETFAQAVLMSRIREGKLDNAPIWDDVSTFDGKLWRGRVDCIAGGFPCQDVSVAGKRAGIKDGNRSGLWKEYARTIYEVGPRIVLVENVTGLLLNGGLGYVLGDLAEMGYDAGWFVFSAAAVEAPHLRERVWIVSYPRCLSGVQGSEIRKSIHRVFENWESCDNSKRSSKMGIAPDSDRLGLSRRSESGGRNKSRERTDKQSAGFLSSNFWLDLPEISFFGLDDGLAYRVERSICCGNGVVPQQSAIAWEKVLKIFEIIK